MTCGKMTCGKWIETLGAPAVRTALPAPGNARVCRCGPRGAVQPGRVTLTCLPLLHGQSVQRGAGVHVRQLAGGHVVQQQGVLVTADDRAAAVILPQRP